MSCRRACAPGRRSPGPATSRAIACTASKSPGEVIGKPASMTSTPSRASWWAISSFSCVFSEMPGDCSPSRSVVSKISTRLGSLLVRAHVVVSFSVSSFASSRLGLRLRGRHALFPPRGEEKKSKGELARHVASSVPGVSGLRRNVLPARLAGGRGALPSARVPRGDYQRLPRRCVGACSTGRLQQPGRRDLGVRLLAEEVAVAGPSRTASPRRRAAGRRCR